MSGEQHGPSADRRAGFTAHHTESADWPRQSAARRIFVIERRAWARAVRIDCRVQGDRFAIEVRDSGGGSGKHGTGTGQRNVRERLRLVYGAAAQLECCPASDGGYTSTVYLPLRSGS